MKKLFGFAVSIFVLLAPVLRAQQPLGKPELAGIQIVNATCVPQIVLYIDKKPIYPQFPQGLYTGDAPVPYISASYLAVYAEKKLTSTPVDVRVTPSKTQTLLITGDFSKTGPPDELPQPEMTPAPSPTPAKEFEPNVQFRVLSHDLEDGEKRLRYRFFNAVPRKVISVKIAGAASAVEVLPGKSLSLFEQKPISNYTVSVDGQDTDVFINQQGLERNCTVVFYLKNGKPTFMRSFENTEESMKRAKDRETAPE